MAAYLLEIRVRAKLDLLQGQLSPGRYLYLGSARRNPASRLLRHALRVAGPPHPIFAELKKAFPKARAQKRRLFWHVDHLLEHPAAELVGYQLLADETEDGLYDRLLAAGARPVLKGFGSSDRPRHLSHLFALDPAGAASLAIR